MISRGDESSWDQEAAAAYQELVEKGGKPSQVMQAFRTFLRENDMLAYLSMMGLRLVELRRVLKSTGSIYLHCDPTASHYLKILLDAVFGPRHFRNEIVWHYRRWTAQSNRFQKLHDLVLFYTKSSTYTFNQLLTRYTPGSVERKEQGILHRFKRGDEPVLVSDREVQAEGVAENDVWHIPFVAPSAKERLGYPTQKPAALLERIIKASSNKGDLILDPFCGCGTAVAVAEKLKRQWIGIDVTHLAIGLIKHRLLTGSGLVEKKDYRIIGEPEDLEGAMQLAKDDPYQFQSWALGKLGARQAGEVKKGADKGIDGRLYFHDDVKTAKTKQIIFSVKGGGSGVAHVRDLRGVIEREKAEIGVLIAKDEPTKPMRAEAAAAGFYTSLWGKHQKLQIISLADLVKGQQVDYPRQANVTLKRAERETEPEETLPLDL